ncbi:MAG: PDZ domain-containing protein [Planctomycetes bacterium]|nr:PDZ domain-containing protein [Planctomycetota bacterium]
MNELVQQIRQLENISQLVQKEYIKPVSREALWNGAIRGMIEGLDPHSAFFSKDETMIYGVKHADRGRGFGFDWHIDAESDGVIISRIIPLSSADKSGMFAGDRIVEVNGVVTDGLSTSQMRQIFMHTQHELQIKLRHNDGSFLDIAMLRDDFTDTGVIDHKLLRKHIGYIRLSRFRHGKQQVEDTAEGQALTITGKAFRQQLDLLAASDVRALIVDLRGNGGGSIKAAAEVADCFLNTGVNSPTVIVEQVSRNNLSRSFAHTASSVNTYPHWPIVVLIDRHTASSAEIVAAAWQDHHRAILAGQPSTGKTSVQETFSLEDGSSIRLSVAHYQTPNGQDISGKGLTPDILIKKDPLNQFKVQKHGQLIRMGKDIPDSLKDIKDHAIKQAADVLSGILVYKDQ